MGLFNRNKVKNTAETPSANSANEWDSLKNAQFNGSKNNTITLADVVSQPKHEKAHDAYGREILITHEQAQENKVINRFERNLGSTDAPSERDQKNFLEKLGTNQITLDDQEDYLRHICRPGEVITQNQDGQLEKAYSRDKLENLLSKVITTPDAYLIYKEALGHPDQIYSAQLSNLMHDCETPREFNRKIGGDVMDRLHQQGYNYNDAKKAMEHFQEIVFGKQLEYQKTFDRLYAKAAQYVANMPEETDIHSSTFNIPNQNYNAVQDYTENREIAPQPEVGYASYSKGQKAASSAVIMRPRFDANNKFYDCVPVNEQQKQKYYENYIDKPNEDTLYINDSAKVFCVFDGAGGVGNYGGSYASRACAEATDNYINSGQLANDYKNYNEVIQKYRQELETTTDDDERRELETLIENIPTPLQTMANKIQENAVEKGLGGASTGIIINISEDNKNLEYLNVGDSRLYLIRNGNLHQISKDEGEGNGIENAFGFDNYSPKQIGNLELEPDDILFLCSDGIMGDWPGQEINQQTIDNIIRSSNDPQEIVNRFIAASTKLDDTSAIAIKIPSSNNQKQPMYYGGAY